MNDNNQAPYVYSNICEGFSCSERATAKIAVKVGTIGTIFLSLCDSCKSRFGSPESDWGSIEGKI